MKARPSPQEKKRHSYAKDRRNTYGERGANSRFAIAERKAIAKRSNRRTAQATLKGVVGEAEEALVFAEGKVKAVAKRGKRFVKVADEPLGAAVAMKLARRGAVGMSGKKGRGPKP